MAEPTFDDKLAELLGTLDDLMARIDGLTERLDALERSYTAASPPPAVPVSLPNLRIVEALATVYQRQGGRPVSTVAVAVEAAYSRRHALRLLKEAALFGAVCPVYLRSLKRGSGYWQPA